VERIPSEPIKVTASTLHTSGGGMAATAAVAIAALGGESVFWGRIGMDEGGATLMAWLEEARVDVSGVVRSAGSRTATSAVLVDRAGERLLAAFPGFGFDDDPESAPIGLVREMDGVLCDARWPAGARRVLDEARRFGVPSVLDADVRGNDVLSPLIQMADHVIFSKPGLIDYAADTDPGEALRQVARTTQAQLGVTLGRDGCLLLLDGRLTHIPAYPVDARNTTGAGDTFHGAYVLAVAEGEAPAEAARFANAAAAIKCALGDGWRGMPSRQRTHALMETDAHAHLGR
jgi:sulfofructose kinase